ncbi:nicotinate-nucleotide--dimethylbenzimidazole phosphoribosyltransferase [Opitutaceae bacterium EW11]|nr:nicotinate-nucleotide--dimethylbenzimidazole phosphoribosyltransferase [Opitutaceae bacterium EW11]
MTWIIPEIRPVSHDIEPELRGRIDQKTKPLGSLGRLERLAIKIGLIQGTAYPQLRAPSVLIFAGDHGIAAEGVSPYPQEVTAQMVLNFLGGGAAINVFSRQHKLALSIVDAGVASDLPVHPSLRSLKVRRGTRNMLHEPALTPGEVSQCLSLGARVVAELDAAGTNVVLFGEMGIANTSAASLLMSSLLGLPIASCVGGGAGHDPAGLDRKREVLSRVRARHGEIADPLTALATYGGCEIAMMVGAMLEAASRRMLIVNDGFIVTSALLVASKLRPAVLDYTAFAHASAETGHARLVSALGGEPLLDLGLRLGEGTGAALAWPLIVSAVTFLEEMATFASAGVSEKGAPSPGIEVEDGLKA